jgi:hypothetical protein
LINTALMHGHHVSSTHVTTCHNLGEISHQSTFTMGGCFGWQTGTCIFFAATTAAFPIHAGCRHCGCHGIVGARGCATRWSRNRKGVRMNHDDNDSLSDIMLPSPDCYAEQLGMAVGEVKRLQCEHTAASQTCIERLKHPPTTDPRSTVSFVSIGIGMRKIPSSVAIAGAIFPFVFAKRPPCCPESDCPWPSSKLFCGRIIESGPPSPTLGLCSHYC